MPQIIYTHTYLRMSHVTGPGCVLVSLRFGKTPPSGPLVTIRAVKGAVMEPQMDVDRYLAEALEGVAEANRIHGTAVEIEEIEIIPNDYPIQGQVRHCAQVLATHVIEGNGQFQTNPQAALNPAK